MTSFVNCPIKEKFFVSKQKVVFKFFVCKWNFLKKAFFSIFLIIFCHSIFILSMFSPYKTTDRRRPGAVWCNCSSNLFDLLRRCLEHESKQMWEINAKYCVSFLGVFCPVFVVSRAEVSRQFLSFLFFFGMKWKRNVFLFRKVSAFKEKDFGGLMMLNNDNIYDDESKTCPGVY